MRLLLALIICLLPSLSWGATCFTNRTSATWGNSAHWDCGNVPAPFTNYSIAVIKNGHRVNISSNVTIPRTTIGDATSSSYDARMVIDAGITVTLGGDLTIRAETPHNTELIHMAGSTLDLATFQVVTGYYYPSTSWSATAPTRFTWTINGESTSRAKLTGATGSNITYYKTGLGGKFDWKYTDISGIYKEVTTVTGGVTKVTTVPNTIHGDHYLGYSGQNVAYGGVTIDHCTFKDTGPWVFGVSSTKGNLNAYTVQYTDFRNVHNDGTNYIKYLQFYRASASSTAKPVTFNYNTLSNNGVKITLQLYNCYNSDMSYNVFDTAQVDATTASNSQFLYNFFLNRNEDPVTGAPFNFYAPNGPYTFSYNGYIGTWGGAHGLSTGRNDAVPVASGTDNASEWSYNFFHTGSALNGNGGDNPLRIGGAWHQNIHNNIITGGGTGISATALNSAYAPTIAIYNNTFTIAGATSTGGTGSTMYMQENTGGGSTTDNAYTVFKNNLAINVRTSGTTWLYASNNSPVTPNMINHLSYNVYYDPLNLWTKFWNNTITITFWFDFPVLSLAVPTVTANTLVITGSDNTNRFTPGTWVRVTQADGRMRVAQVASSVYGSNTTTVTMTTSKPFDSTLAVTALNYGTGTQDPTSGLDMGVYDLGSINPQVTDATFTPLKWAEQQGQGGDDAAKGLWITTELLKRNGMAVDGTAGQTPASFTVNDIWTAMTAKLQPKNPAFLTLGEGRTYVGAVAPVTDTTAPTFTTATATAPARGLKSPVALNLVVTDDMSAVRSYAVVGSDGDCASALTGTSLINSISPWPTAKPFEYTGFENSSYGTKTICFYAQDAAGNVTDFANNGQAVKQTVTLLAPLSTDTTPPNVTDLSLTAASTDLQDIKVKTLSCTDETGLAQYAFWDVARGDVAPTANDIALTWKSIPATPDPPTSWTGTELAYFMRAKGDRTLYAWCRDTSSNPSAAASVDITITSTTTTPDLNAAIQQILYGELTESYPQPGTKVSLSQAIYMILQLLSDKTISGTLMKVKGITTKNTLLDPAMTFRLNSATAPSAVAREQ